MRLPGGAGRSRRVIGKGYVGERRRSHVRTYEAAPRAARQAVCSRRQRPILRADPGVELPWSETRRGHWERTCSCTREFYDEPIHAQRVRNDARDPKTARHAGECAFATETDPAMLRVLLKVQDGWGGDYSWVECGGCDSSWQVPFFAKESVG
jgi:hypothetical protein